VDVHGACGQNQQLLLQLEFKNRSKLWFEMSELLVASSFVMSGRTESRASAYWRHLLCNTDGKQTSDWDK
jgi:hypothetical protein